MNWGADPSLNWPSRFHPGDVVRLDDGRVAFVVMVLDYSPDSSPPEYELLLRHRPTNGPPDEDIFEPWKAPQLPTRKVGRKRARRDCLRGSTHPKGTSTHWFATRLVGC